MRPSMISRLFRRLAGPPALLVFVLSGLLIGAVVLKRPDTGHADAPTPPREFRGAWIATVDNIDWPSRPGLPVDEQQAELLALLDRAVALNLNAIILQVRPTADALYASAYEPWSEYLTGRMGAPPEPYYDPLAFAVEAAHARGLELHAWFNPYRAHHPTATGPISPDHISQTNPSVVRAYGDLLWLDPGEPEAADHSLRVILDVVARYDIDGVHLDDYFYPYPIQDGAGNEVPFPDDESWARAQAAGVTLTRDDWRRQNVDRFIERLYLEVKRTKPWVKFGISPFGIWRPGYPEQIVGFDAYAKLYADARKWQQQGWLDYLTPQLYWEVESRGQSYPALLTWWEAQNVAGRHLWPGNFASRVISEGSRVWTADEIIEQIRVTRAQPGATGNVHFSMKALLPGAADLGARLAVESYPTQALVPASPWLGDHIPGSPGVDLEQRAGTAVVRMTPPAGEAVWLWVVRARYGERWTMDIVPGWQPVHVLPSIGAAAWPDEVALSVVNRLGREGPVATLTQP